MVKTYLAVVENKPYHESGTVKNHLIEGNSLRVKVVDEGEPGAKLAISHYRLLKHMGKYSLLEVRIETGRKHQIRVHARSLGCSIVGDKSYGADTDPAGRLGLHAWKLELKHPNTERMLTIVAPLPKVLARVVDVDVDSLK